MSRRAGGVSWCDQVCDHHPREGQVRDALRHATAPVRHARFECRVRRRGQHERPENPPVFTVQLTHLGGEPAEELLSTEVIRQFSGAVENDVGAGVEPVLQVVEQCRLAADQVLEGSDRT